MENSEYRNQSEVPLLGYWDDVFGVFWGYFKLKAPLDIVDYLKRVIDKNRSERREIFKFDLLTYYMRAQRGESYYIIYTAYQFDAHSDYNTALYWARKGAKNRDKDAYHFLGNFYLKHGDSEASRFKAVYNYYHASELGCSKSSLILALLYKKGYYKIRNRDYAYFSYLHKAIVQLDYGRSPVPSAVKVLSRKLSECYANGIGCRQNTYLSTFWNIIYDKTREMSFMIKRFNFNESCYKAYLLWNGEHYYLSFKYIIKAAEEGSVAGKAILGKICYCTPVIMYLYETYFTRTEGKLDTSFFTVYPYSYHRTWHIRPILAPIKAKGFALLTEAFEAGDESAAITLQRIKDKDVTLSYMISPFQP